MSYQMIDNPKDSVYLDKGAAEKAGAQVPRLEIDANKLPKTKESWEQPSYEELMVRRSIIHVNGVIGQYSSQGFINSCAKALQSRMPITVIVHTPGGTCDDAWAMHEHLRLTSRVRRVDVLVSGVCQSAGVSLMLAVPFEQRWATANSRFMIHGSSVSSDGKTIENGALNPEQKKSKKRYDDTWVKGVISGNTYISEKSLQAVIDAGVDADFDVETALQLGLIRGVL